MLTRDARQLLINKYNQIMENRINMKCEEMSKVIVCNRAVITEELAQELCIDKDIISLNMVGDVEVDCSKLGTETNVGTCKYWLNQQAIIIFSEK